MKMAKMYGLDDFTSSLEENKISIRMSSEDIQKEITKRIAYCLLRINPAASSKPERYGSTLDEIGYLGSIIRTDIAGKKVIIEAMFALQLNVIEKKGKLTGNPRFSTLTNYLTYGNIEDNIRIEKRMVPKHSIVKSNFDVSGVHAKCAAIELHKKQVIEKVCVVQLNPYLLFANIMDCDIRQISPKDFVIKPLPLYSKIVTETLTKSKHTDREVLCDLAISMPKTTERFNPNSVHEFFERLHSETRNEKEERRSKEKEMKKRKKKNSNIDKTKRMLGF